MSFDAQHRGALKFAVIGHPVEHSLSPVMHAANFASLSLDATYGKFDVAPGDVARFVRDAGRGGYAGLNVTVPHKREVVSALDRLDESVVRYGACNTVKFEADGSATGYNTDVAGFLSSLAAHGFSVAGRKVFVVGCGGAGSAIAAACAYEGAAAVSLANRTFERAESLAERLRAIPGGTGIAAIEEMSSWAAAAAGADLVVNATPAGLREGDGSALPAEAFRPGQLVLDIVPTKRFPPTAALAKEMGAEAVDGLEFLVAQGAESFEIWTGLKADRAAMLRAARGLNR